MLIESDREVIDLSFQSQFHHLDALLAQTLNERETILTRRSTPAGAPLSESENDHGA
jgi:hypothetical protein